jgi:hypothetical protein
MAVRILLTALALAAGLGMGVASGQALPGTSTVQAKAPAP